MEQYKVKTIIKDVDDLNYNLQNEINKIAHEGYEIISHTRTRSTYWDEDIFVVQYKDINQQRELLLAFINWYNKNPLNEYHLTFGEVKDFLKTKIK